MAIGTAYSGAFSNRYGTWPKDGLQVMYWDNHLGSYPRSGTTIKDLSGGGNNGTLNNFASTPTPTSGFYDNMINFDGNNDYVSLSSSWLSSRSEFTVYVVFRRLSSPNSHGQYATCVVGATIGQPITVGNYNQYWTPIIEISGNSSTYFNYFAAGTETSILLDVGSTDYHHITLCVKPGLIKAYYNGVLNDEKTINIGQLSDHRRIPTQLSSSLGTPAWRGNIPVFMGYNKALTKEEIEQIYNYFKRYY